MPNKTFTNAMTSKQDEFYTQLSDIENECRHYKEQFRGKTIFCNCDDPYESNFFKYFAMNFNAFGLKKLIATSYDGSPVTGTQLSLFGNDTQPSMTAYKVEMTEFMDANGDGAENLQDVEWLLRNKEGFVTRLSGNGDFQSDECIELLKEADIIVTNPPFSLFRQYVSLLMQYNKKFLIIGNQNAITYKEIFPLIKNNKLWLGYGFNGNVGFFRSLYKDKAVSSQHKEGFIRISGVMWFTNLDTTKLHEELVMFKHYTPSEYPKFDNFDVINVNKTVEIPMDYEGIMGVPITFLDKYNPDQFEIVEGMNRYGILNTFGNNEDIQARHSHGCNINGKSTYFRIFIRNKHPMV